MTDEQTAEKIEEQRKIAAEQRAATTGDRAAFDHYLEQRSNHVDRRDYSTPAHLRGF